MLSEFLTIAYLALNPLTIQIHVNTNVDIDKVHVYLDGLPIACNKGECPIEITSQDFKFNISNLDRGVHTLSATVEEKSGHVDANSGIIYIIQQRVFFHRR